MELRPVYSAMAAARVATETTTTTAAAAVNKKINEAKRMVAEAALVLESL